MNNLSLQIPNITSECQNYNNFSTTATLNDFLIYVDIIQKMVIITGIALNILNIIVLLNSKLNESPYTYLTALAFSDLSILILVAIFPHLRKLVKYTDDSLLPYFDLYIDIPINNFFISYSIYITLSLTIERFIFVTSPFKAAVICRKSKARKVCICVAIISFAKTVYLPFMYKKSPCLHGGLEQHKSPALDILQFSIDLAIPYLIIFVINITLILSLRKKYIHIKPSVSFQTQTLKPGLIVKSKSDFDIGRKERHHSSHLTAKSNIKRQLSYQPNENDSCYRRTSNEKEAKNQRKLTRSLIAILCCLLVCHLPNFLLEESIIDGIFGTQYQSETAYLLRHIGWRITSVLIHINCTANFVIYCISNKKFYNSSKMLFRRWKYKLADCCCRCCCFLSVEAPARYVSTNKRSQSYSQTSKFSFKAPVYKKNEYS
jgi:hypothetical protein